MTPPHERTLEGRRILVSAGPTWVAIDRVRHIGNFATGRLGFRLALAAADRGAQVTLLFGPGRFVIPAEERRRLEVVEFTYFDDLHALVRHHVGSAKYDAFVHTAAVADFRPETSFPGKITSSQPQLVIRLVPTPKIIDEVKALDPGILLVKFKLEVDRTREELMAIAGESRARSRAELIVANDQSRLTADRHPALILDAGGLIAEVETQEQLAAALLDAVAARLVGAGRG
jgi:phosphopantothenoylcysteine decarboxylase/phosphopantothenate--cysteine ligase